MSFITSITEAMKRSAGSGLVGGTPTTSLIDPSSPSGRLAAVGIPAGTNQDVGSFFNSSPPSRLAAVGIPAGTNQDVGSIINNSTVPGFVPPTPEPTPTPTPTPTPEPTPEQEIEYSGTFEIPLDLYPSTTSASTNQSTNQSQSGIDWDSELAKGLLPYLMDSGRNVQSYADNLAVSLNDQYKNMMRQAMDPSNFQGVLNALSNKNMLRSDVASDTMSSFASEVAKAIANKNFEAQVAQSEAQLAIPQILAEIISLAQASSSSGQSSGTSYSETKNPLAPYELAALISGQ